MTRRLAVLGALVLLVTLALFASPLVEKFDGEAPLQEDASDSAGSIANDHNGISEQPYVTGSGQRTLVEDALLARSTDVSRYQTVPFARFDTSLRTVVVEFNPELIRSRLLINGGPAITFVRPGIPLKVLDFGDDALAVVFKEISSNALFLLHIELIGGHTIETALDYIADANLLLRAAIVHDSAVYLVFYDNVSARNQLQRYAWTGERFAADNDRLIVPPLQDPAGRTYEMIPRVILRSEADGLFLFAGTLAAMVKDSEIEIIARPDGCWRILEIVRSAGDWVALCNTDAESDPQQHLIVNLTTRAPIEFDPSHGPPWNLFVGENGAVRWRTITSADDLRALFLEDLATAKNSGLLNFGSNNTEGRIPWSQVYYLNGLLDILYVARRNDRARDIFQPILADVQRRIDLEIYLIDRLVGEIGYATRAFTVNREPGLFAVQSARLLLLFERYLGEIEAPLPLESYATFRSSVLTLDGHMEVLATSGEKPEWLAPGAYHLRWPKGNAFYFDGVNVPFNHQTEWANAIFETLRSGQPGQEEPLKAATDIIRHFLRHNAKSGVMPESGKWPYWWGTAHEGWRETDGVSINKPEYAGDKIVAWISFRTIDTVAVLSAKQFMPGDITDELVDSAAKLVNNGAVYPFSSRMLEKLGHQPRLPEGIARHYLRISAPWDLSNAPWAYIHIALMPPNQHPSERAGR